MYDNPITVNVRDVEMKMEKAIEGYVFEAVKEIGVSVNKEELMKALKYDRNQYDEGFNDGKEMQEEVKAEICDNYCWYRKQADLDGEFEFDEFLEKYCCDCPLSRL